MKKIVDDWPEEGVEDKQLEVWGDKIAYDQLGSNRKNTLRLLREHGYDGESVFGVTQSSINKYLNPSIDKPMYPGVEDIVRFSVFFGLSLQRTVHLILKAYFEKYLVKRIRKSNRTIRSYYDIASHKDKIELCANQFDLQRTSGSSYYDLYELLEGKYNLLSRNKLGLDAFGHMITSMIDKKVFLQTNKDVEDSEIPRTKSSQIKSRGNILVYGLGVSLMFFVIYYINLPSSSVSAIRYNRQEAYQFMNLAARKGDLGSIRALLRSGVSPNISADNGWTPLIEASDRGFRDCVKAMLEKGADPNACRKDGWNALMSAAHNNHTDVISELIASGAKVNQTTRDGWSPLMSASNNGNLECLKLLLSNGADINAERDDGWNALHASINCGQNHVVKYLIENGIDINSSTVDGWTPLMAGVKVANYEGIILLVNAGVDVGMVTSHGISALDLAKEYPQILDLIKASL